MSTRKAEHQLPVYANAVARNRLRMNELCPQCKVRNPHAERKLCAVCLLAQAEQTLAAWAGTQRVNPEYTCDECDERCAADDMVLCWPCHAAMLEAHLLAW